MSNVKISMSEFEDNKKRFNEDADFHESTYAYFGKYVDLADPDMVLEIGGLGKIWLGKTVYQTKRTYYYSLLNGHSGDVWHNYSRFIVKDDYGNMVDKDIYNLVHEMVIMGFCGQQSKIRLLSQKDIDNAARKYERRKQREKELRKEKRNRK